MVLSGWNRINNGLKQAGQGIRNWAQAGTQPEYATNVGDITSTGNKFRDFGIGLLAGLGQVNNRQTTLYPTYNYMGNGLARSSFANLNNPYQFDIADSINRLASLVRRRKANNVEQQPISNFNNQIYADYSLPTSLNNYQTPGLYNNTNVFTPYRLPVNEDYYNLRLNLNTGEY